MTDKHKDSEITEGNWETGSQSGGEADEAEEEE